MDLGTIGEATPLSSCKNVRMLSLMEMVEKPGFYIPLDVECGICSLDVACKLILRLKIWKWVDAEMDGQING